MTDINLAHRASIGILTVEVLNVATKEKLEENKNKFGNTVLYCACYACPIEVVEAIVDKGVNIDGLSKVSICVGAYY
jgi:hypothetical protein